jgi:hypothetical protein
MAKESGKKLTKRQHYVPAFYSSQWANSQGNVVLHNLANDQAFPTGPINALVQTFFYEEDPDNPDNRIENLLSEMEGRAAPVFKKIADLHDRQAVGLCHGLEQNLSAQDLETLSEFAAYQYMRVPGAINLKALEVKLGAPEMPDDGGVHRLNPGRFVEEGYKRVAAKFRAMNVTMIVTPSQAFITSDIPCFDFKNSRNLPMLGEELGIDPDAGAILPLSPRVCAHFSHREFSGQPEIRPHIARVGQIRLVRNINSMIIERAEKFVISSRKEPFIFNVAAKRVRGRPK